MAGPAAKIPWDEAGGYQRRGRLRLPRGRGACPYFAATRDPLAGVIRREHTSLELREALGEADDGKRGKTKARSTGMRSSAALSPPHSSRRALAAAPGVAQSPPPCVLLPSTAHPKSQCPKRDVFHGAGAKPLLPAFPKCQRRAQAAPSPSPWTHRPL